VRLYPLFRPLAFALDAERAHRATIAALKWMPTHRPPDLPSSLKTRVAGLDFPSPIGLAAGFDKNAEVPEHMLGVGFGFVEVGTVTPQPQEGNPKPRMFRLAEDRAVINRLGFNNHGHAEAWLKLQHCIHSRGIIGVNIGANKDSADRVADYADGVRAMASVAKYLTVNISSPNTPGLRQLQDEGALKALLSAIQEAREPHGPPVFLKVAPDLGDGEPDQIVRAAIQHGIDAIIVANTTVSRPALKSRFAREQGGLSGSPLKALALQALRDFRSASGGQIPLIGVGGIASAEDAWERIRAGASLVQLYTAMVYQGPGIARRIARRLAARLKREGIGNVADLVGTSA
jgi:dihydroorotate dehydrogenase